MKWESEGIDFGELDPEQDWESGYQKTDLVKRAKAFKNIFLPIYITKIRECEDAGNYKLAREYYEEFRIRCRKFFKIVISLENAKAYYIMQEAILDFIKKLGIPIKESMSLIRLR